MDGLLGGGHLGLGELLVNEQVLYFDSLLGVDGELQEAHQNLCLSLILLAFFCVETLLERLEQALDILLELLSGFLFLCRKFILFAVLTLFAIFAAHRVP